MSPYERFLSSLRIVFWVSIILPGLSQADLLDNLYNDNSPSVVYRPKGPQYPPWPSQDNEQSPFFNYDKFFNIEYLVNGLWNTILIKHYIGDAAPGSQLGYQLGTTDHPGDYGIFPEAFPAHSDTRGLMMDLVVARLLMNATGDVERTMAKLAYEGKGAKGKGWGQIRKQLGDWMNSATDINRNQDTFSCWCVGARGAEVAFFRYSHVLRNVTWNTETQQLVDTDQTVVYNIQYAAHWAMVKQILPYMRGNNAAKRMRDDDGDSTEDDDNDDMDVVAESSTRTSSRRSTSTTFQAASGAVSLMPAQASSQSAWTTTYYTPSQTVSLTSSIPWWAIATP